MGSSACGVGGGSYGLLFLVFAIALLSEAAYRAAASNFLVRDKKVTKETRLPTASGGTHCALAALRSNSRRKYEGLPQNWGATLARAITSIELVLADFLAI